MGELGQKAGRTYLLDNIFQHVGEQGKCLGPTHSPPPPHVGINQSKGLYNKFVSRSVAIETQLEA